MYKRVLLASDQMPESLVALREGALIARAFQARAFLLIIDRDDAARRLSQSISPTARSGDPNDLLGLGLGRLAKLGVAAKGELVFGEPQLVIPAYARSFNADLIVVGHRRQTFLERWWSGASGAYLVDGVSCSVLLARDTITDDEFERYLALGGVQSS
jgi:nucleotide-binding universal stress UspA family protein